MASLKLSEDVRPVSDLKSKAAEIIRQVSAAGRSVVLTRHGRGVAVLVSLKEYEYLQQATARQRIAEALRQGEEDIAAGRTLSQEEMMTRWAGDE